MSPMILNSNHQSKYLNYFIGLYKRNTTVLAFAAAIYFVFVFIGVSIGYFFPSYIGKLLTTLVKTLQGAHIEKTTLSIFAHNFQSILITYIGGIIGIIPALALLTNGFTYGAFLGYFLHGGAVSGFVVFTPAEFIIYTLPHGIFEITGFIISAAAAFRLTTLVVGLVISKLNKTPASEHYWKLKDSLALLAIATVLIFIAAIIEANFSVSVGNYITGLNIP